MTCFEWILYPVSEIHRCNSKSNYEGLWFVGLVTGHINMYLRGHVGEKGVNSKKLTIFVLEDTYIISFRYVLYNEV